MPKLKKAKIITRQLDCYLTADEKAAHAELLAHAIQEKNKILLELHEAKTGFKKRIEAQEIIIQGSSNAINNGKEPREVDCTLELNKPNSGIKTYTRKDTGESWTEDMTPEELQEDLNF